MSYLNFHFDEILIRSKLKKYESPNRLSMHHKHFIHSAVVLLIIPNNEKPYDLFMIQRTKRENDKHSGEMSFPGGKFEPEKDKDYLDTALRELEEEVGIPRIKINVLGCIDDHLTPKGFIITAFVASVNETQKMKKQDEEVQEILRIPINFFANKSNYKERTYYLNGDLIGVGKFNYRSPNNHKRYVIFGATSHIIVNYIKQVYDLQLKTPVCRRVTCSDLKEKILR